MAFPDNPLEVFFDLVPTGAALYAPVYDAGGELVDFRFARLNPAGQRLLGLPAQPPRTLREYYPGSVPTGIFAQYRTAYLTGQASTYDVPYVGDGLDTFFRLVAQRSGELLVVNFTDMGDLPRVKVEQALRESQAAERAARAEAEAERQRLYQVLMCLPANIALLRGPAHIYDLVNREYEQLFPARTTLGRTIREVIPDIAGQGFYELFDRVYETGEPFYEAEAEAWADYAGTGEPQCRYYRTAFEPIRNAQGEVTEVLNFAVDVTAQVAARRQVEQLNQELEARVQQRTQEALALQADLLAAAQRQAQARETFYQVFEQTPAAICVQRGPAHRYEYVNAAYQRFFSGRVLVGKNVVEAVPEVVENGLLAQLDHVYQTGETFYANEVSLLIAQADNSPSWVHVSFTYQAMRENGEIVGISTFVYDVTVQVLARQQREVERRRLERLLLEAPAAICVLDGPDLVYELVNPSYQALFPGRELLGKPILAALPEITDNPVYTTLRQVYDTGQTHEEQALLIPLARPTDGVWEDRYFRYIQQPRYAVDGRIDGVLVFAFEVTAQLQNQHRVQELNEKLQASNEELGESNRQLTRTNVDLDTFVYTASHDLKAPITNIESIVLALRDTLPPAVQQAELVAHLLALLDSTVARFQFTITQLTDISRLQLAHVGPAEPVELAQVVEAVRLDLAPAIVAAETQLTVVVAPGLVVSFSPANLRSIVYNLLSNAIKYHAPDRPSQVQVRAEQTPQAVVFTVQDNGLGMSELQQRQLFGLFQRLHTHVEGTGVGLYITKRLVENAGGTITVHSQPDVGTTFTVSFPA